MGKKKTDVGKPKAKPPAWQIHIERLGDALAAVGVGHRGLAAAFKQHLEQHAPNQSTWAEFRRGIETRIGSLHTNLSCHHEDLVDLCKQLQLVEKHATTDQKELEKLIDLLHQRLAKLEGLPRGVDSARAEQFSSRVLGFYVLRKPIQPPQIGYWDGAQWCLVSGEKSDGADFISVDERPIDVAQVHGK